MNSWVQGKAFGVIELRWAWRPTCSDPKLQQKFYKIEAAQMRKFNYILLVMIFSVSVGAEEVDLCDKGSMRDMMDCKSEQYRKKKIQLQNEMDMAIDNLNSDDAKKSLRSVQELWQKYMEAQCRFDALPYEGVTYSAIVNACMGHEFDKRIKKLHEISTCSYNDCP
ncbi:MAG: lysozyme inhibitor LprI family protein [Pseudomonadota bacterium]